MKRARSASPETAATDNNNNPQTGEQKQQTPYISLQQIIKLCDALDDDEAPTIALAAKTLLKGSWQDIRRLCSVWDVSRKRPGWRTDGERPVRERKAELHAKLAQRALELQEKKSCESASEQNPDSCSVPACLLYTSPSPRDQRGSRMPSSA